MNEVLGVSDELNKELQLHDAIESTAVEVHKEDFGQYSKSDLLKFLTKIKPEENFQESSAVLKSIRAQYDHLFEQEQQAALQRFVDAGSAAEDFQYRKDETSLEFEKEFQKLKDQISSHFSSLEKQKSKNIDIKRAVLEKMRAIISSEESADSLQDFKKLQEEWRNTGPVPAGDVKELWASYQALTEMYYNNRSVYSELKELDRRKNLLHKQELVSKIEQLVNVPVQQAFNELRKLQEEFRHVGPVPKEDYEAILNRLKAATEAINEKRQQFYDEQAKKKEENFVKKVALIERLKEFEEFTSDKIDDWKAKSELVLAIQEEWKKIGPVPEEKLKELSKHFWAAGKKFFANKNVFFKKLDQKRKENLARKTELCEQAEALKESTDYAATSRALMNLQKEWAKVGQVPLKYKDSIYERFKAACDFFFKKQRDLQASADAKLVDNLKAKEAFLSSLEAKLSGAVQDTPESVLGYITAWDELGYVPIDQKKAIQDKFKTLLESLAAKLPLGTEEKETLLLQIEVKQGGGKKVETVVKDLQRKSMTLKTDIDRYKTNMDFLANSPKASQLKEEVEKKIKEAEAELKKISDKLRILKA